MRIALGVALGAASIPITAILHDDLGNSAFMPATVVVLIALITLGGFWPTFLGSMTALVGTLWIGTGSAASPSGDTAKVAIFIIGTAVIARFDARARRERAGLRERELAFADSEARYRLLLEEASDAILVFGLDHRAEMVSARAADVLGRPVDALIGRTRDELLADFTTSGGATPAASIDGLVSHPIARPDGSVFVGELSTRRLTDGRVQVIVRDVTARLEAAEQVKRERDLLEGILETSTASIIAFEVRTKRVLFANHRLAASTGKSREQLMATGLDGIGWEFADVDGAPLAPGHEPAARVLKAGKLVRDERMLGRTPGGPWQLISYSGAPLFSADGSIRALVFSFDDITERVRAEQSLLESEHRLRRLTDAIPGAVYEYVLAPDGKQRFEFVSAGITDLLRLTPDEAIADFNCIWGLIVSEDQERIGRTILDSARTGSRWNEEFQLQVTSGVRKWIRGTSMPEPPRPDGSIRWNGLLLDITEHKRVEGDLLQIQKMESIGRLAGGIAHDFNNILTAIRGNVDLVLGQVTEQDAHFAELHDIRQAADRAAALTRQLLAFSRKQAMQPRDIDLAELVRDVEKMLRRVIGEDVVLLTQPSDTIGMVRADPGQLEQVLLNLAVNARDAMPTGGLLTIETHQLRLDTATSSALGIPVGDYVSLVVRDTGQGMDEETKVRIFDPFFTTKPAGRGTGLGLAMVYGIVRQSGGAVAVESDPDHGTTFRLYFPRVATPADRGKSAEPVTPVVDSTLRRDARVLLVEDDPAVRALTRRMLREAGYTVQEASDAYEALGLVGADCAGFDLVVTDVIMPGMGGRDLAAELRRRRPDMRILFMSGYLDIDLPSLGLDGRTRLLSKPFTRASLLRDVSEMVELPVAALSD
ncbi:MAG: response regulator [Gemmatimonadaceae bacterium]|nr:response regulator [Gemmatimonadaceae bacterium]